MCDDGGVTSTANERLAAPLRRHPPNAAWPRALVGAALLMAAFAFASARFGWPRPEAWVAPVVAYVVGLALVWSPLDLASVEDARRPEVVVGLFARDHWARVLVGIGLAFSAMWWFATWEFTDQPVVRILMVPPVLVAALALLFGPWLLRLARQVRVERSERIREFERAEIAAHLHDSVLQTLTLIRKHSDDPATVAKLARAQERDLRTYLYQDRRTAAESVATALAAAISSVEDAHAVAIDVVSVGDAPTDKRLRAAVAAAKEAASNAAKHGVAPISVYAEVTDDRYQVFVRDSGPGFNPKRIPADRLGIRESIVGRVERHGGFAAVASRRGQSTEVTISVPRSAENGKVAR
jgi:signal transduction histidine kinase